MVCQSDHPRACGANYLYLMLMIPHPGSSPRMRGKLVQNGGSAYDNRIIPAHAGQTISRRCPLSPTPDHPRACGANWGLGRGIQRGHGSSPRMRGKPRSYTFEDVYNRIIPAHAGQTVVVWCGLSIGSSPRMRGKPIAQRAYLCGRRIIPAHAGQTENKFRTH